LRFLRLDFGGGCCWLWAAAGDGLLSSVLVPLGVAGIISILLKPVIDLAATRLTLNRNRAITLVLGIFFGLGAVLFFLAARSLLSFVDEFAGVGQAI
jgi:predicted PurR-regulated permease PerM